LRAQVPAAIDIAVMYNRADGIRKSVHDVEATLVLTMILVVAVIFLFLRNLSATLIPALALPTSIMFTFGAMALLGFSLDNLSLMALTLCTGFVVDDAIVVLENVVRHMQLGKTRWQAALDGSREISFTVLAMTLSLVAVFIPVLFMAGILGRLFNEFGITISIAILASGFASLTLTPMLASRLLREHEHHGRLYNLLERGFEAWRSAYIRSLDQVLGHRRLTLLATGLILLVTLWLFGVVPKGFLPSEDTGLLLMSTEAAQGVSLAGMTAHQQELMAIINQDPNVKAYMSSVGAGGRNSSENQGTLFLHLKDRPPRKLGIDQVMTEIRAKARKIVGLQTFVTNPPALRIGGQISKSQYQLMLQGPDTQLLYAGTGKLLARLKQLPDLVDVTSDMELSNPQVNVDIDRDKAAAYGLTASDVETALMDAYGTRQISTLYGSTDQYQVILAVDPKFQKDPAAMGLLQVRAPDGRLVPLQNVARLTPGLGPVSVNHVGPFTATTVSFDVKPGVALSQATSEVMAMAHQVLPDGISAHFGGSAQVFQDSITSLAMLLGLAILVIYIVLGILYESFIHPLTVLSGLPSAGLGALLTLLLFGKQLDLYAFVGLIMLVGIVKKNAIILIDFAIERGREGKGAAEAIREACYIRFRPIMMTTMAALMGTLPIAIGLGAGGSSRQGLGLAVVGGLLVSQLLTLYITPVVYLYLDKLQQRIAPASGPDPGAAPVTVQAV
ncbi:MAG: efflux RND transporter permease subunit, partial [Cyanobacteria bacterium REEB65]|nr:efflux RND transporter permease subunit [Cyanobacteria bacterium REEB65]